MSIHKLCIHCYVSGKVQGVWFRAHTQKLARQINLTGWVKNLPDNRVEVFACGQPENLEKLFVWLKTGPELAKVTDVSYEELPWQVFNDFNIEN